MVYSISQKREIYYAQRNRREERVKREGLWDDFVNSKYNSLCWFLKSINRMDLY